MEANETLKDNCARERDETTSLRAAAMEAIREFVTTEFRQTVEKLAAESGYHREQQDRTNTDIYDRIANLQARLSEIEEDRTLIFNQEQARRNMRAEQSRFPNPNPPSCNGYSAAPDQFQTGIGSRIGKRYRA